MIQAPSTIHVAKGSTSKAALSQPLPKPHGPNSLPKLRGPRKDAWSQKEMPNGCYAWLYIPAPISLCSPISNFSHIWPQLPAFQAGVALWCGANYLQALPDPITNPYLGSPSWLHPVTLPHGLPFLFFLFRSSHL